MKTVLFVLDPCTGRNGGKSSEAQWSVRDDSLAQGQIAITDCLDHATTEAASQERGVMSTSASFRDLHAAIPNVEIWPYTTNDILHKEA